MTPELPSLNAPFGAKTIFFKITAHIITTTAIAIHIIVFFDLFMFFLLTPICPAGKCKANYILC